MRGFAFKLRPDGLPDPAFGLGGLGLGGVDEIFSTVAPVAGGRLLVTGARDRTVDNPRAMGLFGVFDASGAFERGPGDLLSSTTRNVSCNLLSSNAAGSVMVCQQGNSFHPVFASRAFRLIP